MTRSKRRKMQRKTIGGPSRLIMRGAPLTSAALLAAMSAAYGQTTPGGLEEIVVTAQKREESLQDVPLAIQAISTERLEQLNVSRFDDFVRFLPSVSYQSLGPGSARIYMRGVASGGDGNHSASLPSVGIYLDEQPITTIQGPLDVHMYDIQRVEALAGPQGTLFGASSQAGTLRIITNRPDPAGFDAAYGLDLNTVSGGDEGYLAEGFVNIPLSDRAAVRLVGWARHDAGYLDNVRSTRVYPTAGFAIDNSDLVEENFNDVDTYGGRAALRFDINDNWTVTPTIMAQSQESNGIFGYDRTLGANQVAHARPDYADDTWVQAALTVEGRIANFDVVYAGAYLDRDVEGALDYQDYSFWYDSLYQYVWYDNDGAVIEPTQYIQSRDDYKRQSHEIRLTSPRDARLRYTLGGFYQKAEHDIQQRYKIDDLGDTYEVTGWSDTIWLTKQDRTDIDYAVFGQADFDITDRLTATFGLRYFWVDNSLKGFNGYGIGYADEDPEGPGSEDGVPSQGEDSCILQQPFGAAGPDFNGAPCLSLDKSVEQDDHSIKLGLQYELTDDKMIYATYAEGFRPGGINRRGSLPPYLPDFLDSFEVGWKTSWAGDRLRFNGAVFFQQWKDFQFPVLGANGLTEIRNAPEAEINGIEADVVWMATEQLSLTAAVSFLNSELSKPYCGFVDENDTPVAQDPCPTFDDDGNPITVPPEAPEGQKLPVTPDFKGNMTARYNFSVSDFASYVQGVIVYVGERESDLRTAAREIIGKLPAYTTVDFAGGFGRNNWNVELYAVNLFDDDGEVDRWAQCSESICGAQTYALITQPRTVGIRFSQEF